MIDAGPRWRALTLSILSVAALLPRGACTADPKSAFHIQAHRGAGSDRPENTLESFEYAWGLGVTPEADLRISRDGTIVCFHDKDLARVVSNVDADTSTKGVEQLTDEQIDRVVAALQESLAAEEGPLSIEVGGQPGRGL